MYNTVAEKARHSETQDLVLFSHRPEITRDRSGVTRKGLAAFKAAGTSLGNHRLGSQGTWTYIHRPPNR